MAKVTEQDLLDRGFKKIRDNYYVLIIKHKILDRIYINASGRWLNIVSIQYDIDIDYPLTHANLDLFIRFAEGKEL